MTTTNAQAAMLRTTRKLAHEVDALRWHTPSHVYNPLLYAWAAHRVYLTRYAGARGRVLLLGMNPGPWGMTQTGVPFGDVRTVREWFQIESRLANKLPVQHPKYPILGMACHRHEGSGSRLWGWAADRIGTPEDFFARFFVWNYCPLLFIGQNRNLIPEKLSRGEADALAVICDRALRAVVRTLQPSAIVGIGRFAERRATEVFGADAGIGYLPHPSPANPDSNRRWPELAEQALGPWLPPRRH